jgi:hypothetical protein
MPVANVSWSDVQSGLGYLNKKEGLSSRVLEDAIVTFLFFLIVTMVIE